MINFTDITLGELLSHTNETIRRNAISIYKTLIAINKKICLHTPVKNICISCGETTCEVCGQNDEIRNKTGICQNIPR